MSVQTGNFFIFNLTIKTQMRKIYTIGLAICCGTAAINATETDNSSNVITLDLTKAATDLRFNEENGAWEGTYDDEEVTIDSQCFTFIHSSISDYATWWGFTASNSADNKRQENTLTFQFSNMAAGGIALNDDGTVRTDEYGAPEVDPAVPYLVAYYSAFMSERPVDMVFNTGKSYDPVGMYVNLNSYSYYTVEYGDSYARAFTNGDKFTLTVHGVAPDETEKTLEVVLASYTNGDLTINRGWKYVDLSALGTVNELYFTMKSTDSGAYGDNTPAYFCLDKLMVKENESSAMASIASDGKGVSLTYDKASSRVSVTGADFAAVYDVAGKTVMTSEDRNYSISHLSAGVYMVKAGNSSLKIAR